MNHLKAGMALAVWWCEGTKLRRDKRWRNSFLHAIEITNSNPQIIKLFLEYLIQKLNVDICKIKGQLQVHENDDKFRLEKYWSSQLGLPISQFNKTIVRKIGNKPNKNMGTFKLRLYSKLVFEQLSNELNILFRQTHIIGD